MITELSDGSTALAGHDDIMEIAAPRVSPSAAELDDLEVLLLGGFGGSCDVGRGWVELAVTGAAAHAAESTGLLIVLDEEGAPFAEVGVSATSPLTDGRRSVCGTARALRTTPRGSHPLLRLRAASLTRHGRVLGVPVDRPLHAPHVVALRTAAARLDARLLLLPLTGDGTPLGVDGSGLVRACLGIRTLMAPVPVDVVPIALPRRLDATAHRRRALAVARAYGATHVTMGPTDSDVADADGSLPTRVPLPEVSLDLRNGAWTPSDEVPLEYRSCLLYTSDAADE